MNKTLVIVTALLIAAFRPVLLFHEFNPHVVAGYTAAAHIFIGVLLGAWLSARSFSKMHGASPLLEQPYIMRTFWALAAVEVACFAIGKFIL